MKTLYVSDLDGTLSRSDESISDYTNDVINRLTCEGMIFSYATARSAITAKKVTKGLDAKIPIIVYNGAFILDNNTGEKLLSNFFDETIKNVIDELLSTGINPIVYAFGDGKNDIDMFEIADESYAVENANADLKKIATAVIPSNDEDGVARWLSENR